MPIRIYALAKELQIDSKELVDICTKAGITGKGSALASLTDEETDRLKSFLAGGNKSSQRAVSPLDAMVAPRSPNAPIPRAEKAPAPAPPAPSPAPITPASKPAGGESPPPPVLAPLARAVGSAGSSVAQSSLPEAPAREAGPLRGDFLPSAGGGKIKVLGPRIKKSEGESGKKPGGDSGGQTTKREPVIRVAAMPKTSTPPPAKSNEPAPQKPIMTLPPDAIRSVKSGTAGPLSDFTRQQEKNRPKPADGAAKRPTGPGTAAEEAAKAARDKTKRPKAAGVVEEEEGKRGLAGMAGSRAARQDIRRSRKDTVKIGDEDEERTGPRRPRKMVRKGTNTAAPRKERVAVELPCTIRAFCEAVGIPTSAVLRRLFAVDPSITINTLLDMETAESLVIDLEIDAELREAASLEDQIVNVIEGQEDDPEQLVTRPPVITFLGHVDHGKTSLLDRIIGIDVVSGEAGGITQHIRAYTINKDGRQISFVDTPGHEAFTEMRARGANVTDIAVLVVAADDGVMPQTEEAISHAKAAGVPIIVALNKIDLPGVDVNRIMQQLSQHDLLPAEWGGEVEVVKTSATTGTGIDDLLETILLTADIHEYKANPHRDALGTCLEAQQEAGRGVVAKLIVQNGTLRVGDILVCGSAHGRVKAMFDSLRGYVKVKEAGPSIPVNVTGLDRAPQAGDRFYVLDDIVKARDLAQDRELRSRESSLTGRQVRVSFEDFQRRLTEGTLGSPDEIITLNLILRADVRGSIEAIVKELGKLDHPEIRINILQASVGGVTVADVTLADASNAVIVGFNVIPDEAARSLAEERGVEIRRYDIIYKVTEDIKALLEGKLKPEERVAELGRALVKQVFTISRVGAVAGCQVLAGTIERNCRIRVNRDGRGIGEYALDSLRREKDDVKEVRQGMECGMKLAGFNDLKEGDILEAFKIEEVARTL